MTSKNKAKPRTAAALAASVPPGWAATVGAGYSDGLESWPSEGVSWVRFTREEGDLSVAISLNVVPLPKRPSAWERDSSWGGRTIEGHTTYNRATFTVRGVDCESCNLRDKPDGDHSYDSVALLCVAEFERCRASHARSKTMVAVPGLPGGWRVTPKGRDDIAAKLKRLGCHEFRPAGFGAGCRISTIREVFDQKLAPPSTAAFFGLDALSLYYSTTDCD